MSTRAKRAKLLLQKSQLAKKQSIIPLKSAQSLSSSTHSDHDHDDDNEDHHHHRKHRHCDDCPNVCEGNWNGSYGIWPGYYPPFLAPPIAPYTPYGLYGTYGPTNSYCNPVGSCAICPGSSNCAPAMISPWMAPSPLMPVAPINPYVPSGPYNNYPMPIGPGAPPGIAMGPLYDSMGRPYDPMYANTNCRGYGGLPW